MKKTGRRHVRPMLEGLEGRQMLSTAASAAIVPQAISLTSTETGTYSVRMERSTPLLERFHFNGSGMIPGLGPVRVQGSAIVREDLAQAGTVSGTLVLTLPGHGGTARALISEPIPAHTGSSPLLPFHYMLSGGTGRFRNRSDIGTGVLVRTSETMNRRGATGGFVVSVFSDHYTGLVAFGDSLTDVGNRFTATGGAEPASPPYDAGRWSDGPIWLERLAAGLGLSDPTPSALGGTDYAAADAGTALSGYAHNGSANIGTQVTAYLSTHPTVDGDPLFVIWGGTNDFGPHTTPDPAESVANLSAEITELAKAGARQFLVPDLMPLGEVPAIRRPGPAAEAQYDDLATQFNTRLAAAAVQLEAGLGIKVHHLDVYGLVEQVLADPGAFGITDVTDQAKSGDEGDPGAVAPNPDQYLFWDNIHPAETFQRLLGNPAIQAASQ
jgi:phospholipase/lecithinase/hemolysin